MNLRNNTITRIQNKYKSANIAVKLVLLCLLVNGFLIFIYGLIYLMLGDYRPMKICLDLGPLWEGWDAHVWGLPNREWLQTTKGVLRQNGDWSPELRVHFDPGDEEEGVEFWPKPRHQFGLNLTPPQKDLFARVSIVRFFGGMSLHKNVTLLKPVKDATREMFWYSKCRNNITVLQTDVFISYSESPFLLSWLRTFREGKGMETELSKMPVHPERLYEGGFLQVSSDKSPPTNLVLSDPYLIGYRKMFPGERRLCPEDNAPVKKP